MQRLEVSGAVQPIYGSLGVKRLKRILMKPLNLFTNTTALLAGERPKEFIGIQQNHRHRSSVHR